MEVDLRMWQTFVDTGDIKAYLLYKGALKYEKSGGEESKWQISAPRAS